jgi:hypothetical protein
MALNTDLQALLAEAVEQELLNNKSEVTATYDLAALLALIKAWRSVDQVEAKLDTLNTAIATINNNVDYIQNCFQTWGKWDTTD